MLQSDIAIFVHFHFDVHWLISVHFDHLDPKVRIHNCSGHIQGLGKFFVLHIDRKTCAIVQQKPSLHGQISSAILLGWALKLQR